ncbi:metal-sensing transcriptional repressor [Bullifex porci]|uniref:metal-sensing transcriptional repressor n=1 Tax=Bullifex porci TaxID=2606638 RepID=UPI0023F47C96|nr:metal-sensing transcriptional repressor [Bullifex porci]MDD7255746.1 metal-sensing transcriptional repressor [Bullifex porci]MDY2741450.1 metal-sensing transcriptional repressor [Bullifex porci]
MQCCCKHKNTERSESEKKDLITRLNRVEGQIRGIKKMVEENIYCNDILIQTSAATAALNAFNRELLKQHLSSCVKEELEKGNDEVIAELVKTLEKMMK